MLHEISSKSSTKEDAITRCRARGDGFGKKWERDSIESRFPVTERLIAAAIAANGNLLACARELWGNSAACVRQNHTNRTNKIPSAPGQTYSSPYTARPRMRYLIQVRLRR